MPDCPICGNSTADPPQYYLKTDSGRQAPVCENDADRLYDESKNDGLCNECGNPAEVEIVKAQWGTEPDDTPKIDYLNPDLVLCESHYKAKTGRDVSK